MAAKHIVKGDSPAIFTELNHPHRYKVMFGGRGSGKSWTVAKKLLFRGMRDKIRVLCTRELQRSIKQSVHKLLSIQIDRLGMGEFYDVTGDVIRGLNGTEFIFMGVKFNAEEIKSTESVDICWIEEAHNLTEASWDIIDPTIRQEGSEIWVTMNPRFKFDHIYQSFIASSPPPDSWVQKVNHGDNPYFPEVLQRQMENMREKDYEKYLHVWEGELKQLAEGAIFGKQIAQVKKDGRLCSIPIQSNCEVHFFFDLGKNDETAIWMMQQVGREYHFIDYYENRLQEIEHYTRWIKSLGYLTGRYYMPHDAEHDRLGMTRNIRQQFEDGGIRPVTIVPRIAHKATAIELAREKFANCWFHKGDDERGLRMERGFEVLSNYRYKFKQDDNVFQLNPHHDFASNGSDAFQTFAQGFKESRGAFDTSNWHYGGGVR